MKTVVVGISGGVDSAVSAYLLKQQGYNVIGLFMVNWEESDDSGVCSSETDYEDVKRVCNAIGIPYYTVNYSKQYYDKVFTYFLEQYKKGNTPNPDVLCNREVKFGPFLDFARKIGADYIATGHYAKKQEIDGKYYLLKAFDKNKDQSYFLNQLSQDQLKSVLFPLADIEKTQVRKIAEQLGLSNAHKKDSTGICFIGERNFRKFLKNFIPAKRGEIKTLDGKVVGTHDGVMYYTLGQRRGLGVGGQKDGGSGRWFVVDKDVQKNILYVTQGEDDSLYSNGLISGKFNFIPCNTDKTEFDCYVKFRYRQPDQKVHVKVVNDHVELRFYSPQRAVTCGQYVVLYDGEYCLGGAEIEEVLK